MWTANSWRISEGFAPIELTTTTTQELGTDFPFGCRWCARTTKYDGVEICELLEGVVHSECHQRHCTDPRCAYLVCTPEFCDDLTPCDECGALSCARHGVSCYC